MGWKFWQQPTETRADYTQQMMGALERAALARDSADIAATAAARMAAGFYARAFAAASVEPQNARTAILTPAVLATMAAALILRGEYCARIEVNQTGLQLFSATSWDVDGGIDPATWRYVVTHPTPSQGDVKRTALAAEVLHPRLADEAAPWRGISPLAEAGLTSNLAAEVERQLAEESGGSVGRLLHIPGAHTDTGDANLPLSSFKADLAALKGRTSIVPAAPDFVDGQGVASTRGGFEQQRIGMDPPESIVTLRENVSASILALCGLKADLFTARTDGTAAREFLRQAVNLGVEPLARLVAAECRDKLGTDVRFDFRDLWAQDIRSRGQLAKALAEVAKPLGLSAADILRIVGFEPVEA